MNFISGIFNHSFFITPIKEFFFNVGDNISKKFKNKFNTYIIVCVKVRDNNCYRIMFVDYVNLFLINKYYFVLSKIVNNAYETTINRHFFNQYGKAELCTGDLVYNDQPLKGLICLYSREEAYCNIDRTLSESQIEEVVNILLSSSFNNDLAIPHYLKDCIFKGIEKYYLIHEPTKIQLNDEKSSDAVTFYVTDLNLYYKDYFEIKL